MPPPPSSDINIAAQKLSFLNRQVRALSAPLTLPPPSQPTTSEDTDPPPPLPRKHLNDLLTQTNKALAHHNRAVFSAQAQQHVAEQIETLFWNEVDQERELLLEATEGGDWRGAATTIRRGQDLCAAHDVQKSLPEAWRDVVFSASADEGERMEDAAPDDHNAIDTGEQEQYTTMRAQLIELAACKEEAVGKVQRYKQLRELLRPYEEAQENIQPNLVGRDGELGREMERMRSLLARVTARMGAVEGGEEAREQRQEKGMSKVMALDERVGVLMGVD